jgi:Arc/MetJ-type ribon-helix-helix transcriptional regulator
LPEEQLVYLSRETSVVLRTDPSILPSSSRLRNRNLSAGATTVAIRYPSFRPRDTVSPMCYHPLRWFEDVYRKVDAMALTELEKITINMGPVDLGQIDLLVREGFYQNRTDFIRTAIRNQLNTHAEAVRQTVVRKELVLGLQHYTRHDLEAVRAASETLEIKVLGLVSIANDVSPELALETIASMEVLGTFRASPAVKAALASRIQST